MYNRCIQASNSLGGPETPQLVICLEEIRAWSQTIDQPKNRSLIELCITFGNVRLTDTGVLQVEMLSKSRHYRVGPAVLLQVLCFNVLINILVVVSQRFPGNSCCSYQTMHS